MEAVTNDRVAFNQGCDARLAGTPLGANPYCSSAGHPEQSAYLAWRRGWHDVHGSWGARLKPGDPRFVPLPPIDYSAREHAPDRDPDHEP